MVEFTPEILAQAKAMGLTEEEAREKWADIDEAYHQGGPSAAIKDMEELLATTEKEVFLLADDARAYFHGKQNLTDSAKKWLENWSPGDLRVLAWAQYLADIREHVDKAIAENRVDQDTLIHWLITAAWIIAEQQDQIAAVKDGNRRTGEPG